MINQNQASNDLGQASGTPQTESRALIADAQNGLAAATSFRGETIENRGVSQYALWKVLDLYERATGQLFEGAVSCLEDVHEIIRPNEHLAPEREALAKIIEGTAYFEQLIVALEKDPGREAKPQPTVLALLTLNRRYNEICEIDFEQAPSLLHGLLDLIDGNESLSIYADALRKIVDGAAALNSLRGIVARM